MDKIIRETHKSIDEAFESARRQNANQVRSLARINGGVRIAFTTPPVCLGADHEKKA